MADTRIRGPELSTKPFMEFVVNRDGFEYRMQLQWLSRFSIWIFRMIAPDGTRVIDGLRARANVPLLWPYTDVRLPTGNLVVHDTTNKRVDPGRIDFLDRHILVSLDIREVEQGYEISVNEQPGTPEVA